MLLLVGAGLTRVATRDRPGMRPLSIEGIQIASEPIGTGQTIAREKEWRPPADVYVVGWSYSAGSPGGSPQMLLRHGGTVLFYGSYGGANSPNPAFYPEGHGYRVPAGEAVTLRLKMANTGPPGQTSGAEALVYFVPVEGN
jgi:hypothetical protein